MSEIVEVVYSEPNENEINMLKGTFKPEELIEIEKTEEVVRDLRKEYITKVKVIALDMCGKSIISNPSNMSQGEKNKIMICMQRLLQDTEEEITDRFNALVTDKMFNSTVEFEKLHSN